MSRRLVVFAAALAGLCVANPAISPTAAADATAAAVRDAHHDVYVYYQDPEDTVSHPIDIYRVRAAKVRTNLVLVMKVNDLTRKNTGYREDRYGFRYFDATFLFRLWVDGGDKPRFIVTRSLDGESVGVGPANRPGFRDCNGPRKEGIGFAPRLNLRRDVVRYVVPLKCIGDPDTIAVAGRTILKEEDDTSYGDDSRITATFSTR